jgi:hypothetical protein
MSTNIDTGSFLPLTLRNQFYLDLCASIDVEMQYFKDNVCTPLKDTFNIRNITDTARLQEISSSFGYYPNTILNSSTDFLKSEISSISYRIKRKTTYSGYQKTFDSIPEVGHVYNLFWNDVSLVKAVNFNGSSVTEVAGTGDGSTLHFQYTLEQYSTYVNQTIDIKVNNASIYVTATNAAVEILTTSPNVGSGTYTRATGNLIFTFITAPAMSSAIGVTYTSSITDINTYLLSIVFGQPFTNIIPQYYYSFFSNTSILLDDGNFLDSGLYLDTNVLKTATHHLAIEICPITLTTVNSIKYLTTADVLDYVAYYSHYNRKVTENPHVGVQICLYTDNSRFYDNLAYGSYTIPALEAKLAVTQDYSAGSIVDMFTYVVAGTGIKTMWNHSQTPGSLTALLNQVYSRTLTSNEVDDTGNYYKVNTYIPSNTITNVLIMTGDGVNYTASGTLAYGNISPKSIYLSYTANNTAITINDNTGDGTMSSLSFDGTIDYSTGIYDFNFVNAQPFAEIVSSTGGISSIVNYQLAFITIIKTSAIVTFTYSGVQYQAMFDSSGTVIPYAAAHIVSGSITTLGVLNMVWNVTLDAVAVTCSYEYDDYSIPANGTQVLLNYKTKDNVAITEIGILDSTGKLVVYGTIPPVLWPDRNYHLGLEILVKK